PFAAEVSSSVISTSHDPAGSVTARCGSAAWAVDVRAVFDSLAAWIGRTSVMSAERVDASSGAPAGGLVVHVTGRLLQREGDRVDDGQPCARRVGLLDAVDGSGDVHGVV